MQLRFATLNDARALAGLNALLIVDEGHRNTMDEGQLALRMTDWLQGEYRAAVAERDSKVLGYALYKHEPEFVYLRQLFVVRSARREGVARSLLQWLWQNAWKGMPRIRIDVLVENITGREVWRSVGFQEYCVTMEARVSEGLTRRSSGPLRGR